MTVKSKTDRVFTIEPREFPQERARRTYEALLEAAESEFSSRGYDATQTPDVAAKAGVSVGTFYRYFADKKEIFLEVLKRDLARGRDEVLAGLHPERFVGAARRETIEQALRVLIENSVSTPGASLQPVYLEMSLRDPDVASLREAFEQTAFERVAELIAAVCSRRHVPDPEATAWVIVTATLQCASRISSRTELDPERALAALTEMTYRALFGIDGD